MPYIKENEEGLTKNELLEWRRNLRNEKALAWRRRQRQSISSWRRRTKIALIAYKGGQCESCGYNKTTHPSAFAFHHCDPSKKDFSISGKTFSIERLKKEVDKCSLLCVRCHNELHDKINIAKLQKEDAFFMLQDAMIGDLANFIDGILSMEFSQKGEAKSLMAMGAEQVVDRFMSVFPKYSGLSAMARQWVLAKRPLFVCQKAWALAPEAGFEPATA